MSGNYSICDRNVLDSLTEEGGTAYLWARERIPNDRMGYAAERFAREVERVAPLIRHFTRLAADQFAGQEPELALTDETLEDLFRFVMKRHSSFRFKGEKRSWVDRLAP